LIITSLYYFLEISKNIAFSVATKSRKTWLCTW